MAVAVSKFEKSCFTRKSRNQFIQLVLYFYVSGDIRGLSDLIQKDRGHRRVGSRLGIDGRGGAGLGEGGHVLVAEGRVDKGHRLALQRGSSGGGGGGGGGRDDRGRRAGSLGGPGAAGGRGAAVGRRASRRGPAGGVVVGAVGVVVQVGREVVDVDVLGPGRRRGDLETGSGFRRKRNCMF